MVFVNKAPELDLEVTSYSNLFKDKIFKWAAIDELYFDESEEQLTRLYSLLQNFYDNFNYVFRGQTNGDNGEKWKLSTTWHRTFGNPTVQSVTSYLSDIEHCLPNNQLSGDDNIEKLMLAQHHGYKTPLLDFSYDPKIALFFAFRDVTVSEHYATINILLHQNFRNAYTNFLKKDKIFASTAESIKFSRELVDDFHTNAVKPKIDNIDDVLVQQYHQKRTEMKTKKLSDFSENRIFMLPNSLEENYNMNQQKGLFIYDTLQYGTDSPYGTDLEDFITKLAPYRSSEDPMLIKAHISKKHLNAIRKFLDDLNINEETLGLSSNKGK